MSKLPPEEQAVYPAASAALDELLDKWREIGVPSHGQTGLLFAAFVKVSITDRGMGIEQLVQDIIDCLEGLRRDASN